MTGETPPLLGYRVAVTHTGEGAEALARELRQRGAAVDHLPLIRFARSNEPEALHRRLQDWQGVNWLLLTSVQAVKALQEELELLRLPVSHFHGLRIAAVGPSTAQALTAQGWPVRFLPSRAGARYLGAELPAQPGTRALHLTSDQAQGELALALQERGIHYERLELYRTEPNPLTATQRQQLAQAAVVALASGTAAGHLAALLGTDFAVAALGEQTAAVARNLGFTRLEVAARPDLSSLADAVETCLRRVEAARQQG